jgi:hypothetical protein
MRPEAKRRLDRLVWKGRVRIALAIVLGLAMLGAGYAYVYWPDPVVETRIVSGAVTDLGRAESKWEAGTLVIQILLDDGRLVVTKQPPLEIPRLGPAKIEERRHRSGRLSYWWVKNAE